MTVGSLDEEHDWTLRIGNPDSYYSLSLVYFDNVHWYVESAQPDPELEFYDDFAYGDVDDVAEFGWDAVDGDSEPPEGGVYARSNIIFPGARGEPGTDGYLMVLSSTVDPSGNTLNSRLETSAWAFLHGTYCARVQFTDLGIYPPDKNVQAFYAINYLYDPERFPQTGNLLYSECDFEYLPYDFWDAHCNSPVLWMNTYETLISDDPESWLAAKDDSPKCEEPPGWKYLLFQVHPDGVVYYIAEDVEGVPGPSVLGAHHKQPYAPETRMQIAFANWIQEPGGGLPVSRTHEMAVDWVYYAAEEYLTVQEVHARIAELRTLHGSVLRFSNIPDPPIYPVFGVDSEGDVMNWGWLRADALATGAADVAEWVRVSEPADAGSLVELDPMHLGSYRLSSEACSTLVAGAVSTEPGVILGTVGAVRGDHVLLALTGIVPVKVTDEGGLIMPGDLLVSSSTPGHAMRWSGPDPCLCALVGKALEAMTDESGIILVLLTAH